MGIVGVGREQRKDIHTILFANRLLNGVGDLCCVMKEFLEVERLCYWLERSVVVRFILFLLIDLYTL